MTPSQHAIESIYIQHYPWLVAWLRQRVVCRESAQDLGQDTFLKMLSFSRPESIETPRAWLMVVANRLLINRFHRQQVEQDALRQVALMMVQEVPSAEVSVECEQLLTQIVEMLIRELPEKQYRTLIMARVEGMSYKEIALVLGVTPHSVKYYLVRAMAFLHERLFGAVDGEQAA
ncbi:RNA polymerase sigma factor [Marinobacterium marinum]|uniref:Sigma-70 family RNA polymerase sigma factor n=1 Tax=Marinobacterium marinum TaxID=2756129 RepID=A0A7W1WX46_9GAMM|nr:sigma-70 family RNA polymerase sigma factor [Marinobacterium marinum]MBA4501757.1 sigma-70 family RNA polymerase sigma factor [Marinobacterium marinum]